MTEQSNEHEIHARLTQLETGQTNLEMAITANTRLTTGVQQDMTELLDILSAVKSGLRVLGVLGGVIKWSAGVITAIGAVWALYHGGPK
jgi:hypothetical protein